jgi:hypothetical protein
MVEAGTEPKPKGPLLSSSVDSITLTIQPGRGSSRDIAGSAKGDSTPTVAQASLQSMLSGGSIPTAAAQIAGGSKPTVAAPSIGGSTPTVSSHPQRGDSAPTVATKLRAMNRSAVTRRSQSKTKVVAAPEPTTHSSIDHGGPADVYGVPQVAVIKPMHIDLSGHRRPSDERGSRKSRPTTPASNHRDRSPRGSAARDAALQQHLQDLQDAAAHTVIDTRD